jgi:hypothetical protein
MRSSLVLISALALALCPLPLRAGPDEADGPTYYKDVAPIFQERCAACHRKGEIGPFPLQTYKHAVGWSGMIQEVVESRRMPPWHADPKVGTFSNDRRLSDGERQTILDWVEGGLKKGKRKDRPKKKRWPKPGTWKMGKPDAVISMPRAFTIPATGTVQYQYMDVKTDFGADRWVTTLEVLIGAPEVVHHVLIFVRYPKVIDSPFVKRGLGGYFASALPGEAPRAFPEGSAKFIPRGSTLRFQLHYTSNGTKQTDLTRVAFKFLKTKRKKKRRKRGRTKAAPFNKTPGEPRRAQTIALASMKLSIPPHAKHHEVTASHTFKKDVLLYGFLPHMHLRGKAFRYDLRTPDGKTQPLLNVPKYDFNWQSNYRLAEPIFVPKGSTVTGLAVFDNSKENRANPDPTRTVPFGEQTWDEMMIGYMDIIEATPKDRSVWAGHAKPKPETSEK